MNRELEREIAAFVEMVDTHLARIAEALAPFLRRVGQRHREALTREIMLRAWESHDSFAPTAMTVPMWFATMAKHELNFINFGERSYSTIERAVLAALGHDPSPALTTAVVAAIEPSITPAASGAPHEQIEAPQIVGKECPPCWRCRWYNGWLPVREVIPVAYTDAEIAVACEAIDKRKIEIAHEVRGDAGWSEEDLRLE